MTKPKADWWLVFISVLIACVLFFIKTTAASEGTFLKYMTNANLSRPSSARGLSLGYQDELFFLDKKLEVGFWTDAPDSGGAKSSGFGSASVGVEPEAGYFYLHLFQGVGVLSAPDPSLGGIFQFFEDLGFGVRDHKRGVSLGAFYKHISNAGLYRENSGRDFLGLQVTIPW